MENIIYSDILSWADPDIGEPKVNTDLEKIQYIFSKYEDFAKYQRFDRKWSEARKIADWLNGCPGSVRIPIYNDDIFACAYRWGVLNQSDSDLMHDMFLENWFELVGEKMIETKNEVLKFAPLSAQANDILKACTVSGLVVRLPEGQLDRKLYLEVKAKLELIGGKWNKKEQGFMFKADPSELLDRVAGGERVNLQKQYQYFATPKKLCERLVKLAGIMPGNEVLEPSAGQGAIIDAVRAKHPENPVYYLELMPTNLHILREKYRTANVLNMGENDDREDNQDFLTLGNFSFDRIVANPPFSNNQDIDHILKMWEVLRPGGRLVSVASRHFQFADGKKEKAFREFLGANRATITDVPAGEFKESGTNIATCIIVLDKPNEAGRVVAPVPVKESIPFEAVYKPIKKNPRADQLSLF